MNDIYYEETAFPQNYNKQKFIYIGCRILTVVASVLAGFFLFLILFSPVEGNSWVLPLLIGVWFILWAVFFSLLKRRFYNCYDYIFVTGDIRIVKVINTKKRKAMAIFDSRDVFQVGRYESETYDKLSKTPGIKTIFAPTNKSVYDKEKFYLAATFDGVKHLIVLECTEKFLKHVLMFAGKSILEKEY